MAMHSKAAQQLPANAQWRIGKFEPNLESMKVTG